MKNPTTKGREDNDTVRGITGFAAREQVDLERGQRVFFIPHVNLPQLDHGIWDVCLWIMYKGPAGVFVQRKPVDALNSVHAQGVHEGVGAAQIGGVAQGRD